MNLSVIKEWKIPVVASLCLMLLLCFSIADATSYDSPEKFNPSDSYLFFFHNYYVEKNGPDGDCKYFDILSAFTDRGFQVVSDIRPADVKFYDYIDKAVMNVEKALANGVSPKQIVIAGHSKGAIIVTQMAARLKEPSIRYIILAGCGIKSALNAYPNFTQLQGTFLSLYADTDTVAASCQEDFAKSVHDPQIIEIVLQSTKGHRLFFTPEKLWLDPAMTWLKAD